MYVEYPGPSSSDYLVADVDAFTLQACRASFLPSQGLAAFGVFVLLFPPSPSFLLFFAGRPQAHGLGFAMPGSLKMHNAADYVVRSSRVPWLLALRIVGKGSSFCSLASAVVFALLLSSFLM